MKGELVLIDFSSIAFPIWQTTQSDPDPNKACQQIVARVRSLTHGRPLVAICCDSGRSFRKDLAESYKANRPPTEASLQHQIALAKEQLENDGFPCWSVKGFEADDLIASGVARALALPELTVLIISADKDLLQLVGPRVRAMSARDGSILDETAVIAKFKVRPDQMRDYLTLVGDTADNVRGAKGVGPVKAADLLAKFDTLDNVYTLLTENEGRATAGIPTAVEMSLREFREHMPITRQLITLRADVDLPFDEVAAERVPKDVAGFGMEDDEMEDEQQSTAPASTEAAAAANGGHQPSVPNGGDIGHSLAVREAVEVLSAQGEFGLQLEPRSMREARSLATDMYSSRLFSAYGTASGILATVMAGRELGMQAMASLRAFHVVEGRPTLAADLIRALVIRSGQAKYFRCTERTPERATFETQRGDDPPIALSYTMDEAQQAGKVKPGSGYVTNGSDMLVARASSKLARLVYPDVVHGLYAREELE